MNTNKKIARVAGFFYLILAITALFTDIFVRKNLIVYGDALATASNIIDSEWLFRLGLVSSLVMTTCWILLALTLYKLFEPVNRNYSSLMVSFVLVGSAITCINTLTQFAASLVLNDADYLKVFGIEQLRALAMLFLDLSQHGIIIASIFFGLWLFPLSYLIYKSGFMPKIISILLLIAGMGYLVDFFLFYLFPDFNVSISDFTFWGEFLLLFYLLVKGVKVQQATTCEAG